MAGLATGLLLLLLAASVCPALHEHLCHHHDSGVETASGCIVFAFAGGATVAGVANPLPAPSVRLVAFLLDGGTPAPDLADAWRTPPACGPPAAA